MEYLRKKNIGIAYERTIKNVKTRNRKGLYEHELFVYFVLFVFNINLCDFASLRSNRKISISKLSRQNHSSGGAVHHR